MIYLIQPNPNLNIMKRVNPTLKRVNQIVFSIQKFYCNASIFSSFV